MESIFPQGVVMNTFAKSSFFVLSLTAALLFPAALSAEEKESAVLPAQEKESTNLLHFYDSELFQWNYSLFGGLTLNFQNQGTYPMFGLKTPMKEALLRYPDSAKEYKSYRGKNITGNVLFWGGYIALLGECFALAMFADENWEREPANVKLSAGILLGSLVSELIGAFLMTSSQEDIYSAVNMYNRNRIADYK
jgi:hypothetical protein